MLKYKVDKAAFEKLDNAVQALYKQDGDNYVLEVDGVKTVEDVENVQEALRKERDEHTKTKDTLKATEAERNTASDKVKVYESDDKKKLDSEQLVEFERLKRENETLTEANTTLKGDFEGLQGEVTTNTITAHLRKEAVDIMRDDAIENEIAGLAKDFVVVDEKC